MCTTSLKNTLWLQSSLACLVWLSEQHQNISQNNSNLLHFITETVCVYYSVRTRFTLKVPVARTDFLSYFGFPVSRGFHQCSLLIFIILQKKKRQSMETKKTELFQTCGRNEHKKNFILLISKLLLRSPGIVKLVNMRHWHWFSWQLRISPVRTISPINYTRLHTACVKRTRAQPANLQIKSMILRTTSLSLRA